MMANPSKRYPWKVEMLSPTGSAPMSESTDTINGHTFTHRRVEYEALDQYGLSRKRQRSIRKIDGKVVSFSDWMRLRGLYLRQEEARGTGWQVK